MKTLQERGWGMSLAVAAIAGLAFWAYTATANEKVAAKKAEKAAASAKADGAELFNREWLPKDARARGGDGLGPVFNDTSCVACHNQGGTGGGGPGYMFDYEKNDLKHLRGSLSMAHAKDINTNGSQFFIVLKPQPHLDGIHTVFGKVTRGDEILDAIKGGDTMKKVEVFEEAL